MTLPWHRPSLATAGHIKIGALGDEIRTSNNKTFRRPVKLDHIVVTKPTRDGAGNLVVDDALMSVLLELYGSTDPKTGEVKLLQLPIALHSNNLAEAFPCSLAYYSGKKRWCYGDGQNATRITRDGASMTVECPCEQSSLYDPEKGKCKPHATLHCSIRVKGHGLFGSVYRWRTTSSISIERMIGSLQQVLDVVGSLVNVPLMLVLSEVQLQGKAPVWCCHVELRESTLDEVQRIVLQTAALRQQVAAASKGHHVRLRVLQPGGDHEDEEEQAAVAAEFHPEGMVVDEEVVGQDDLE